MSWGGEGCAPLSVSLSPYSYPSDCSPPPPSASPPSPPLHSDPPSLQTRQRSTSYSDRLSPDAAAAWKRRLSESMKARWQRERHQAAMTGATRASAQRRRARGLGEVGGEEAEAGVVGGGRGEEAGDETTGWIGGDTGSSHSTPGGAGVRLRVATPAGGAASSPRHRETVSPSRFPAQAGRAPPPSQVGAKREDWSFDPQPTAGMGLPGSRSVGAGWASPPSETAGVPAPAAKVAARRRPPESDTLLRWGGSIIEFDEVEAPTPPPPPQWLPGAHRRSRGSAPAVRGDAWSSGDGGEPDEADFIDLIMREAGLPEYVDPAVVAGLGAELGILEEGEEGASEGEG